MTAIERFAETCKIVDEVSTAAHDPLPLAEVLVFAERIAKLYARQRGEKKPSRVRGAKAEKDAA